MDDRPLRPPDFAHADLQREILEAWQDTFPDQAVELDSNFYEIGGNSVIAMQLMEKICDGLQLEIPVVVIYQNPTPRQIVRCVQEGEFCSEP